MLSVDSSVFVAALIVTEPGNEQARSLIRRFRVGDHEAVQPMSVVVEVAAALQRRTGSIELVRQTIMDMRAMPTLEFAELTAARVDDAVQVVEQTSLRGMDALVTQVAREFNTTLVTLDRELAQRATPIVSVREIAELV